MNVPFHEDFVDVFFSSPIGEYPSTYTKCLLEFFLCCCHIIPSCAETETEVRGLGEELA